MDNTAWLGSWLTELNLSEYISTFENAGCTTPELCAKIGDKEKLKSIGVSKVGHLNRLFRALEKLASDLSEGGRETAAESSVAVHQSNNDVDDGVLTTRPVTLLQTKSSSLATLSGKGTC